MGKPLSFSELPFRPRLRAAGKAREEYLATASGDEIALLLARALPNSTVALFDDATAGERADVRLCGTLDVADACRIARTLPARGTFDLAEALDNLGHWNGRAFERAFAETLRAQGIQDAIASKTSESVRRALDDLCAKATGIFEECSAWFDDAPAHEGRAYTAGGDPIL